MSKLTALIREMCPNGVEYRPLGEVIERLRTGLNPRKNFVLNSPGATNFYVTVRELGGFRIETSDKTDRVDNEGLRLIQNRSGLKAGDVLFSGTGTIGRTALVSNDPTNWNIKEGVYAITPCHNLLDSRFLIYVLNSSGFKDTALSIAAGGTVKSISMKNLQLLLVPVPPLEVQQEIVRVLDAFTDLEQILVTELELRKEQYDFYRGQLLSETNESGDQVPLGDLGRIVTGRTPKSNDTRAWGYDVDFVTPSDIRDGMKEVTAPKRQLSQAGSEALARSLIPAGSILVTCIGADMGKTVINANDCVTNQQINSVILNPGINPDYVFHFLTAMRPQLLALGSRSSGTMPILNKTNFSRIQISLPSLDEQNRIARKLNKFESLIFNSNSGIAAEINLRRKQYAFYRDELLRFTAKEA